MKEATKKGAIVSIADPAINLKRKGGTVRPKTVKRLSLPMIEEAYGVSPKVIRKELFYLPAERREA